MFSIPHLIIIFVVVLIVFGPEKLPDLARNLGKIMGEFRRATGDLRSTFDEHMRDIEREASMRAAAAGTGATIAPTEQNTIGQPKLVSAAGTVTADAPHGWTVAPGSSPTGENAASDTTGATQADGTTPVHSSGEKSSEVSAHASVGNVGAAQAEVNRERIETEPEGAGEPAKIGNSKGSDGGSRPA